MCDAQGFLREIPRVPNMSLHVQYFLQIESRVSALLLPVYCFLSSIVLRSFQDSFNLKPMLVLSHYLSSNLSHFMSHGARTSPKNNVIQKIKIKHNPVNDKWLCQKSDHARKPKPSLACFNKNL